MSRKLPMILRKLLFVAVSLIPLLGQTGVVQDHTEINKLIQNLYKQTTKDFLYSTATDINPVIERYTKTYSKYYTDDLVFLIVKRMKSKNASGPNPPFSEDLDPRFPREGGDWVQRTKIKKLRIHQASAINGGATVRVDYATDQTDNRTYITIYYLKETGKGWRIKDQFLGYSSEGIPGRPGKNPKYSPDLVEILSEN